MVTSGVSTGRAIAARQQRHMAVAACARRVPRMPGDEFTRPVVLTGRMRAGWRPGDRCYPDGLSVDGAVAPARSRQQAHLAEDYPVIVTYPSLYARLEQRSMLVCVVAARWCAPDEAERSVLPPPRALATALMRGFRRRGTYCSGAKKAGDSHHGPNQRQSEHARYPERRVRRGDRSVEGPYVGSFGGSDHRRTGDCHCVRLAQRCLLGQRSSNAAVIRALPGATR